MSYDPVAWHDFFVMLGGSAAALTGLIFVALSLHLDRVAADPFHRFRAGVSVAGLTSMIFLAGAVLAPTQSHEAVGIEVIAISAFFVWLNLTAGRHPPPVLPGQARPRRGWSTASRRRSSTRSPGWPSSSAPARAS
jgi:hypothetical protein